MKFVFGASRVAVAMAMAIVLRGAEMLAMGAAVPDGSLTTEEQGDLSEGSGGLRKADKDINQRDEDEEAPMPEALKDRIQTLSVKVQSFVEESKTTDMDLVSVDEIQDGNLWKVRRKCGIVYRLYYMDSELCYILYALI